MGFGLGVCDLVVGIVCGDGFCCGVVFGEFCVFGLVCV